jgi:hypothetical protein
MDPLADETKQRYDPYRSDAYALQVGQWVV